VLLVLCQRLKGEEPIENVRGFLHEVIKNEVYNHNRRAKLDIEPDADADEEPCAALDPEEAVALAQRWEKLEGYVERLSDVEAEVFKCADLEGLTIDATAEKLGRPRGTVATQLARARSKLEAFVEESERGGTLGGDGDKR
jgi:RNA polymerase sigma factor (sigma-70 family)